MKKEFILFIRQLLKDKNNSYSLRELVIAILLVATVISWIAQQFFGKNMPDSMFYTFASLIAGGCFGYSFERKARDPIDQQTKQ